MAAAFLTQTVDAKLSLANKLARAEALVRDNVRDNVQRSPVSYQADAVAAFLGGGPYHSTHGCLIGKG